MRGSTSFKFLLAIIFLAALFVDGLLYAEVLIKDPGTYVVDTAKPGAVLRPGPRRHRTTVQRWR